MEQGERESSLRGASALVAYIWPPSGQVDDVPYYFSFKSRREAVETLEGCARGPRKDKKHDNALLLPVTALSPPSHSLPVHCLGDLAKGSGTHRSFCACGVGHAPHQRDEMEVV